MGPNILDSRVRDSVFGENVTIMLPANIYGATFGDNVFVGPFCEVQSEVFIGDRSRIQSHSFICSLVTIGDDCFIGHGVMFTNDLHPGGPNRGDRLKLIPTVIGARVSIGSGATILPVSICSDVEIGAGAVVTRDIQVPGIYAGIPARRIGERMGSSGAN
jgi:acetyltransferase-like isoleucine patch superfamily enzyme